jgi:hypothetical protein
MMSRMGSIFKVLGGARFRGASGARLQRSRAAGIATTIAASLIALASVAASTPDVRVTDRVAAVYDFAVVDRADLLDHVVAFVSFATPSGTGGIAMPDVLVQTAEHVPGIDPGTARATANPPSLSFSYDARRADLSDVLMRLAAATPVPVQFALIESIRPAYPSASEPMEIDLQR